MTQALTLTRVGALTPPMKNQGLAGGVLGGAILRSGGAHTLTETNPQWGSSIHPTQKHDSEKQSKGNPRQTFPRGQGIQRKHIEVTKMTFPAILGQRSPSIYEAIHPMYATRIVARGGVTTPTGVAQRRAFHVPTDIAEM